MCANNAHIVFNRERYMFITNINEAYQASKSQIVTSIMQPTVSKFETVQHVLKTHKFNAYSNMIIKVCVQIMHIYEK